MEDLIEKVEKYIDYYGVQTTHVHYDNGDAVVHMGEFDLVDRCDEDGFNYYDEYIIRINNKWYRVKTGWVFEEFIVSEDSIMGCNSKDRKTVITEEDYLQGEAEEYLNGIGVDYSFD